MQPQTQEVEMKFKYSLAYLFSLNSLIFNFLSGENPPQGENLTLLQGNRAILENSKIVDDFYELDENETWREVTDQVLASSDTPELSKESIRQYHRRIFVFKYPSDNLMIKGFISFTPQPEFHPLLILYRWGNENFALMNPGVTFATYKDYTVISSTLRGGISEGEDEFGGKDVDDMKNLIKYVPEISKKLGIHLQPSCVFMIGPSRGGMEMFLTLAHFPELQKKVNKVVAISAILDLHQLIQDRPYDMKTMFEHEFGFQDGPKGKEWIAKRDPMNTIPLLSPSLPILVIQGTNDDRIGLKEGHRMVDALKKTGHDVSYWEIKGGDHVLMNQPQIMNNIAHWLESNSPCMSVRISKTADIQ